MTNQLKAAFQSFGLRQRKTLLMQTRSIRKIEGSMRDIIERAREECERGEIDDGVTGLLIPTYMNNKLGALKKEVPVWRGP